MRSLSKNNHAQIAMAGAAIGLFITIIISIMIYYNIVGGTRDSMVRLDQAKGGTYNATRGAFTAGPHPADNATTSINSQAATFWTVAPIIGIVIVAVVVIGYVQRIGG